MSLNFPVQIIRDTISLFNTEWLLVDAACNNIDFGLVENFGNVGYPYYIDKYAISESTIADYNRDPNNILSQINIDTRGDTKPATNISWNEVARFVNWLNERENIQPAYNFTTGGVNDNITLWDSTSAWQGGGENRFRHKNTKYFIPSEDEWYKAAYFDLDSRVYYNFSTGSNNSPTAIISGTGTGTVVYNDNASIQPTEPADINQAGGLSPVGTMGQGGNTAEWLESAFDRSNNLESETRSYRGGSYISNNFAEIGNAQRSNTIPTSASSTLGFRIAYAPVGTGSAEPNATITFVSVGDVANADYISANGTGDWPPVGSAGDGFGGVPYEYEIDKFAIKGCDIDAYNLDPANATKQITTTNSAGYDSTPAVGLSWNNCARYINWLNEKEGEQPAYNFTTGGVNDNITLWDSTSAWQNGGENLFRHKYARYFIPSEDEWIKAAFYNPNYGGVGVAGYHRYPHPGLDPLNTNPPQTSVAGGTAPNTTHWKFSAANDGGRAPVDFAGGLSHYGTMGQSGNAYEWMETTVDGLNDVVFAGNRALRGGTATIGTYSKLTIDDYVSGFNPVQIPGPSGFRVARAEVGTGEDPFPADPGVELLFNEFDVEAETTPNTGSLNTQPSQDAYSLFQSSVINNGVVTFDGNGDHINIPGSLPSFTNGSGTDSPFSISCWVKSAEAIGSDQVIIAKQSSGAYEWALSYTTTGEVNIILSTTDLTSGSIEATSTSTFTQNVWQHVLVTYDGTKDETGLKIYIDGTLETVTAVENGTYTGMSDTASSAYIGRRPIGLSGASDEFEGDMDNMRIYYRLLAGEEIAALFAEGHD